jgi:hypothetical protein
LAPSRPRRAQAGRRQRKPGYDGLSKLLTTPRRSPSIFASDDDQFIGGARLLHAGLSVRWNGDAVKPAQVDGTTMLLDCRLPMYLRVQPDVAAARLSD